MRSTRRPWGSTSWSMRTLRSLNGSTVAVEGSAGDDYSISYIEVRIDSGLWDAFSFEEEWSYALDTRSLGEGQHTIDFRAHDGLYYSDIDGSTFEVRFEEDPPDDTDGEGGIDWDTQTYLIAGGIALMAIAMALLIGIAIARHRAPPDS